MQSSASCLSSSAYSLSTWATRISLILSSCCHWIYDGLRQCRHPDRGEGQLTTLFVDPMVSDPIKLIDVLQINFLQPFYNFTFANGMIACLVFMGIGVITDLDFFIARPFLSLFLAFAAELGTLLTLPLAVAMDSASKKPHPLLLWEEPMAPWSFLLR